MRLEFRALIAVSAALILASALSAEAPAKIPYRGLSATLPELFRNRSGEYLNGCGDCTYEGLSSVIEDSIRDKASDGSADVFAVVEAFEEGDTVTFNVVLEYAKNDVLPLSFLTEGSGVKVWTALPCSLYLELAFRVKVDSDTVLGGRDEEGVFLDIERFTLRMESLEGVPVPGAAVRLHDTVYRPEIVNARVRGDFAWYLSGVGDEESEDSWVSYKDLEEGEYRWIPASDSGLEFSCSLDSGEEDAYGTFEIEADSRDLMNPENPLLILRTPEETEELSLTLPGSR